MTDLWGTAIYDYYFDGSDESLTTKTNISESEQMPVSYLFRDFEQMPELEKIALKTTVGNILDVGAGAGSHSLYLQNNRKLSVTAMDISGKAVEICQLRGLRKTICADIFEYNPDEKFDAILLLMNGTGICGKLENLSKFLLKLKSLINIDGQILVESSDLQYMYDLETLKNLSKRGKYYGELQFSMQYKENPPEVFDWLYTDFDLLKTYCAEAGMECKRIYEGDDDEFLAKITIRKV